MRIPAWLACGIVLISAWALPFTAGLNAAQPAMIYVDTQHPAASDNNPGTRVLPFKTLNRATTLALERNKNNVPVKVVVYPGLYPEAVSLPEGGTGAPITFQAARAGQAVISGSDVWRNWARGARGAIFTHPWPYAWGVAAIPPDWPQVPDIARRREMVFVDGHLLKQVLTEAVMTPGTFFVDEGRKLLYAWASTGIDLNAATVEVAVRPILFAASARANLTISGLVFEHAATALDGDAVLLHKVANLVVEDAVFRWNNWGGVGVYGGTTARILHSAANNNGGRGMATWKVQDLTYDSNEASYNNWRGAWGRFLRWAMAGIKILRVHGGVIRRQKAIGNHAYGLWLDFDNQDVTIQAGLWCGNLLAGGFVEASQGPVTILAATACKNGEHGVFATESRQVTLKNSVLYGNGFSQLQVGGTASRTVENWETGQSMVLQSSNWTLCGNAIAGSNSAQYVLAVPNWEWFLSTLKSSRNVWWNPEKPDAFLIDGGTRLDFTGWRKVSRQDIDSAFADPKFTSAERSNFAPLQGSPWQKC